MKNILIYKTCILMIALIYIGVFLITPAQAQNEAPPAAFFSALQDIPLKPGLAELVDQTVTFDKPEGRIVEQVAKIESGSANEIRAYYKTSLPQLGWRQKDADSFIRENEHLTLRFESYGGEEFLRLMVEPR